MAHMAQKRDYYDVLGVDRSSDAATIKKAYRKLAMQYHPDRNKDAGAEDMFKEISEAYAVLSDEDKKSRYDQYGHSGIDGQFSQEDIFRNADFSDIFGGGGLGDIFGQMFGFGGGSRRASRGRSLEVEVAITLKQAFEGAKVPVRYNREADCNTCEGSGAEPGTPVSTCGTCGGSGQVAQQVRTPFGVMQQVGACRACQGQGKTIETHCRACGGSARMRDRREIEVDLPAGIDDGQGLRVQGGGDAGAHGLPPGDLIVRVHVRPHERFHREGDDLLTEVPITFPQASLGAKVELETMDGKVDLTIPAGVESGKTLRMRGKGMPSTRHQGRGDLHVRLRVVTPKKISEKAREHLEALAAEWGDEIQEADKKGFFGRMFS